MSTPRTKVPRTWDPARFLVPSCILPVDCVQIPRTLQKISFSTNSSLIFSMSIPFTSFTNSVTLVVRVSGPPLSVVLYKFLDFHQVIPTPTLSPSLPYPLSGDFTLRSPEEIRYTSLNQKLNLRHPRRLTEVRLVTGLVYTQIFLGGSISHLFPKTPTLRPLQISTPFHPLSSSLKTLDPLSLITKPNTTTVL